MAEGVPPGHAESNICTDASPGLEGEKVVSTQPSRPSTAPALQATQGGGAVRLSRQSTNAGGGSGPVWPLALRYVPATRKGNRWFKAWSEANGTLTEHASGACLGLVGERDAFCSGGWDHPPCFICICYCAVLQVCLCVMCHPPRVPPRELGASSVACGALCVAARAAEATFLRASVFKPVVLRLYTAR